MEIKGTVERVVKEHVGSLNKDKWIVLVGGKSYDCWSSRIEQFVGKELPEGCTITPATNEKYNAKLNLPKEGFGGQRGGGGRPSDPDSYHTTAYNAGLMVGKDLVESMTGLSFDEKEKKVLAFAEKSYKQYSKLIKGE